VFIHIKAVDASVFYGCCRAIWTGGDVCVWKVCGGPGIYYFGKEKKAVRPLFFLLLYTQVIQYKGGIADRKGTRPSRCEARTGGVLGVLGSSLILRRGRDGGGIDHALEGGAVEPRPLVVRVLDVGPHAEEPACEEGDPDEGEPEGSGEVELPVRGGLEHHDAHQGGERRDHHKGGEDHGVEPEVPAGGEDRTAQDRVEGAREEPPPPAEVFGNEAARGFHEGRRDDEEHQHPHLGLGLEDLDQVLALAGDGGVGAERPHEDQRVVEVEQDGDHAGRLDVVAHVGLVVVEVARAVIGFTHTRDLGATLAQAVGEVAQHGREDDHGRQHRQHAVPLGHAVLQRERQLVHLAEVEAQPTGERCAHDVEVEVALGVRAPSDHESHGHEQHEV